MSCIYSNTAELVNKKKKKKKNNYFLDFLVLPLLDPLVEVLLVDFFGAGLLFELLPLGLTFAADLLITNIETGIKDAPPAITQTIMMVTVNKLALGGIMFSSSNT